MNNLAEMMKETEQYIEQLFDEAYQPRFDQYKLSPEVQNALLQIYTDGFSQGMNYAAQYIDTEVKRLYRLENLKQQRKFRWFGWFRKKEEYDGKNETE